MNEEKKVVTTTTRVVVTNTNGLPNNTQQSINQHMKDNMNGKKPKKDWTKIFTYFLMSILIIGCVVLLVRFCEKSEREMEERTRTTINPNYTVTTESTTTQNISYEATTQVQTQATHTVFDGKGNPVSSGGSVTEAQTKRSTTRSKETETTTSRSTTTSTSTVAVKSNNANLKDLYITGYSITPAFDANTTKYTLELPRSDISSVLVTAIRGDYAQSVDGTGSIVLSDKSTEAKVTVTAEDGTQKTYTITIIKPIAAAK